MESPTVYHEMNEFSMVPLLDPHPSAEADDICMKMTSGLAGTWGEVMLPDRRDALTATDAVDISPAYEQHSDEDMYQEVPPCGENVLEKMTSSETSEPQLCRGCGLSISDRFLLRAAGSCWHENCLRCSVCAGVLTSSCFVKDRRLLCRHDYARLYGARCASCFLPLPPQEMVMRAQSRVYHVRCFACVVCGHLLQQGDQYVTHNEQLFCRLDFEKEFAHMRSAAMMLGTDCFALYSPKSDCDDSMDENDGDPGKGPKRPRTILTTSQRRKFKAAFELNPKPCRKVRETLAQETGLSVRVVQVWFQNQRAKMKKIARKQNGDNDSDKKASQKEVSKKKLDSSMSDKPSVKKAKAKVTGETPVGHKENCSSFAHQLTALSAASTKVFSCSTLDTVQSYHPNHHVTNVDNIIADHQGQGHVEVGSCHDSAQAPIDRLFCMQDSYFSPS